MGILQQGLRIAPPEASRSGWSLGKVGDSVISANFLMLALIHTHTHTHTLFLAPRDNQTEEFQSDLTRLTQVRVERHLFLRVMQNPFNKQKFVLCKHRIHGE